MLYKNEGLNYNVLSPSIKTEGRPKKDLWNKFKVIYQQNKTYGHYYSKTFSRHEHYAI